MKKIVWDRLGIVFSSACAIHCVMVAFLPLFFPIVIQYVHSSWIHIVVVTIILFTSPLAFVPGYRKHGITWILGTALLGLMLVFMGILLEDKVSNQPWDFNLWKFIFSLCSCKKFTAYSSTFSSKRPSTGLLLALCLLNLPFIEIG